MDKLLQLPMNEVLISNDGATILSKMKVLHPAAKMLVELSKSQDIAAGDGTTTVVVLAGALLEVCANRLLHRGTSMGGGSSSTGGGGFSGGGIMGSGTGSRATIHPTQIAASLLRASQVACGFLTEMAVPVDLNNRAALLAAVETCLSSKVVAQNTQLLAPIAVDSVLALLEDKDKEESGSSTTAVVDLRDIRLVEQVGGTVDDTELVVGGLVLTAGKASTSAASSVTSQQNGAKILFLQYCLSAPKTDMDNTVVVSDYAAMDRILRQERQHILKLCKNIKKTGCNVLLLQKSILRDAYNELSLHFLAKMGILVVTDVERGDVDFICRSLGCQPVAHEDQLSADKLGHAESVKTVWMEGSSDKVVRFDGVRNPGKTVTVLLRGSNELVLAEAARSLHDAQCVVRNLVQERYMIAGGGAAETHVSLRLRKHAETLTGKDAHCFKAFAEALEVIPYTLAQNAGMKPIHVVTELRAAHAAGKTGAGINVKKGKVVSDMYELNVVQPLLVTTSAIRLATETVALIMKIDDLLIVQ
jgi:T-complex protein 1 subunit delta